MLLVKMLLSILEFLIFLHDGGVFYAGFYQIIIIHKNLKDRIQFSVFLKFFFSGGTVVTWSKDSQVLSADNVKVRWTK